MNPAVRHCSPQPQLIIAAARKLFSERGFHQTSMADLAVEAGVSVGSIYRAFAGKAEIIRAIIQAGSSEMLHDLERDVERVRKGTTGIEDAIGQIILRHISQKDDALTHEMLAEAHRNPDVGEMITGFCVRYRDLFVGLAQLANPSLGGSRLDGAAELLTGCVFGIGYRALTHPLLDEAATAREVRTLILDALRSD